MNHGLDEIISATDSRCVADLQKALLKSEIRFRAIFDKAAIGIVLVDKLNGTVLDANPALEKILGYTTEELREILLIDITYPEDIEISLERFAELKNNNREYHQLEKRYIRKDGELIWVNMSTTLVGDTDGQVGFIFGMIEDITQRKQLESSLAKAKFEAEKAREEAERLAFTDYLTGLYNRRAFISMLIMELGRAKRKNKTLSIILIDVDNFKIINDTYGHLAGDTVLQEISQVVKDNLRTYDFVGRYGGEEFIICLPDTIGDMAVVIAERIRTMIAAKKIFIPEAEGTIQVTVSMGISSLSPKGFRNLDHLIKEADVFLYKAKRSGRNRVCYA